MQRRKFLEMLGIGAAGLVLVSKTVADPKPVSHYNGSLNDKKAWKIAKGFPRKQDLSPNMKAFVRKRWNELSAEMYKG